MAAWIRPGRLPCAGAAIARAGRRPAAHVGSPSGVAAPGCRQHALGQQRDHHVACRRRRVASNRCWASPASASAYGSQREQRGRRRPRGRSRLARRAGRQAARLPQAPGSFCRVSAERMPAQARDQPSSSSAHQWHFARRDAGRRQPERGLAPARRASANQAAERWRCVGGHEHFGHRHFGPAPATWPRSPGDGVGASLIARGPAAPARQQIARLGRERGRRPRWPGSSCGPR